MGADIVGWCDCPLQQGLKPDAFFAKLKLRALKMAVDEHVGPAERTAQSVTLMGANREPLKMGYDALVSELDGFDQGIPECPACPLSGGAALGCYRYVSYPIDATFERLVFDFFVSQVVVKDSIADQLYRDIVSRVPSRGTPWHTARGSEPGAAAELPAPLQHEWGGFFSKKRIDSAQILASLFVTLNNALVVGYANLWLQLDRFGNERGVQASRTLVEIRTVMSLCVSAMPLALRGKAAILVDG